MIYMAIEQHQADKIRGNVGNILFWLDRVKSRDMNAEEINHVMDLIREQAEAAHNSITEIMKSCLMTRDELTETVLMPCLQIKNNATDCDPFGGLSD